MRISLVQSTLLICMIISVVSITFPSCKAAARAQHDSTLDNAQTDRLKGKTCLLVLPASQYDFIDDYKALLPTAWTLTPIDVIKYDMLPLYSNQGDQYAFFMIGGIETSNRSSNTGLTTTNTHYFLSLNQVYQGKKKPVNESLCRIEMYPEFETTNYSFSKKDLNDQIYQRSAFRNYQLPYILAYLRFIQKNVEQQKNPWVYENYTDEKLKQRLAKDTLYVLDNELFDRNKFTGHEEKMSQSIFSSYPGKYKFVKPEELISIIRRRKSTEPIFLFEYVLSSTDKFVSVLDINSGTVVYRRYTAVSYNLKSKDIDKILD